MVLCILDSNSTWILFESAFDHLSTERAINLYRLYAARSLPTCYTWWFSELRGFLVVVVLFHLLDCKKLLENNILKCNSQFHIALIATNNNVNMKPKEKQAEFDGTEFENMYNSFLSKSAEPNTTHISFERKFSKIDEQKFVRKSMKTRYKTILNAYQSQTNKRKKKKMNKLHLWCKNQIESRILSINRSLYWASIGLAYWPSRPISYILRALIWAYRFNQHFTMRNNFKFERQNLYILCVRIVSVANPQSTQNIFHTTGHQTR